jgi:hypothetical protein
MTFGLTYMGCEGVLVRSDAGSVLIDGLYGGDALRGPAGTRSRSPA